MPKAAAVMTLGQISEALFILLLPIFLKRYGIKTTLIVGMLAWVIRYILFAYGDVGVNAWMLIFGVILHGICYDFFFVTGQLYVDKVAPDDIRSSAQGFIAFVTLGVGMFIGGILNGWWNGIQSAEGVMNWEMVWYFPAALAGGVMLVFALSFKAKES